MHVVKAALLLQDRTLEEVEVNFQQEVSLLTKKLAEEQQKYARLQVRCYVHRPRQVVLHVDARVVAITYETLS